MVTEKDLAVVNIVASGQLDLEIDLAALETDLRESEYFSEVKHSRKRGNRLFIHFNNSDYMGILTSSGVYIFTGGDTDKGLNIAKEHLFTTLFDLGIISAINPPEKEIVRNLEIRNRVFTVDLGKSVNLNSLAVVLGFENIEYEPEQFPGLVYRPPTSSSTILVFASGKIVVPGGESKAEILKLLEDLEQNINTISI